MAHRGGVEVKAGEPLTVKVHDFMIHISQALLVEVKDKNEAVLISVVIRKKTYVLGTLSEKFPQIRFDLLFDSEFIIFHNRKHRSVYITGYKSLMMKNNHMLDSDFDSDNEEMIAAGDGSSEEDDDDKEEDRSTPPKKKADQGKNLLFAGGHGKKGDGHVDTHPSRKTGKTPAKNEKSKPKTPKICYSSGLTFNSDGALQSH
ncbi:hypothetical protein GIB67_007454 [Kingdonia uniflora]|uniref:Nucleoplasmin-like domain-containing protein n=1 Tax=Kingdonia uniflora TaxID=39325 RepID=A0A7J7L4P9_9MAGN|nr:hypothetical protein GIB67_007454 [Kingdonia uniflora]